MAYKVKFVFGYDHVELEDGYDSEDGIFYIDYDAFEDVEPKDADEILAIIICDTCSEELELSVQTDCHFFELDKLNESADRDGWVIDNETQCCDSCCGSDE
jgi:hypothetical protein